MSAPSLYILVCRLGGFRLMRVCRGPQELECILGFPQSPANHPIWCADLEGPYFGMELNAMDIWMLMETGSQGNAGRTQIRIVSPCFVSSSLIVQARSRESDTMV
jgi:hypothetical protein